MTTGWSRQQMTVACLVLVALTAPIYLQTGGHGFISFDDNAYLYANPALADGLTAVAVKWSFTTFHQFNWHPLTWLSHLLDVTLFGLNPGGHHLHSALLHGSNACLLFLLLTRATDAPAKSLLVAALFAVHPLRAESVAWAAERKDVLSAFFGLTSIWCYVRYAQYHRRGLLLLTLLLYAASLMSKPLLVTLPAALLLLDWWPLRRWQTDRSTIMTLLREKIPFLLLAAASAGVTLAAQYHGGAVATLQAIPAGTRIGNALISYAQYLTRTLVPVNLSVYYPFTLPLAPLRVALAAVFLLLVSGLLFRYRHRVPAMSFGWAWFILTLLPMIGIIQVGGQAMADRYTYLTTIGLTIALVWGGEQLALRLNIKPSRIAMVGWLAVIGYGILGWQQVTFWRNGTALFGHALRLNPDNYMALTLLGDTLREIDQCPEAIPLYQRSLQLAPFQQTVYNNYAICLSQAGRLPEARQQLVSAILLNPGYADAHFNLGMVLAQLKQHDNAVGAFTRALQLNPDDAAAHYNLGKSLDSLGRTEEAISHFALANSLDPSLSAAAESLRELRRRTDKGDGK